MMRRKLNKGAAGGAPSVPTSQTRAGGRDGELSEDNEARPIKGRSKGIRFNEEDDVQDKDTPPTRSRSRKTRSRANFDEPGGDASKSLGLKSALKDISGEGSKSTPGLKLGRVDRSRGSSKSRSAAPRSNSNNRVFHDPSPGVGG